MLRMLLVSKWVGRLGELGGALHAVLRSELLKVYRRPNTSTLAALFALVLEASDYS